MINIYTVENGQFVMDKIDNTLDAMQDFVDGPIEIINITEDIVLVCNEEGKLRDLETTAFIIRNHRAQDYIAGKFFICKEDGEDLADVEEDDLPSFKRTVLLVK